MWNSIIFQAHPHIATATNAVCDYSYLDQVKVG